MADQATKTTARFEFTNTEDPTQDDAVKRIESRITLAKRGITTSIKRALELKASIDKQVIKGISSESSIIIGMKRTGTGHIEAATNSNTDLEHATDLLMIMFEEIIVQDGDRKTAVDKKIANAEQELVTYSKSLNDCRDATINVFDTQLDPTLATSTRDQSPQRRGAVFNKMIHLLPSELSGECSTSEYKKFKRDFDTWFKSSYPGGQGGPEVWGTLNSKLDADWQDRMDTVEGIKDSSLEAIWIEMDKVMMSLHPVHTRRIGFLSMKPSKNETPSHFIQSLKEQATDARISSLTEASLILHLTTAGLQPSELNKAAKSIIIEELRKNPDQADLDGVVSRLKGLEADHLATADKTSVKQVNQEFFCKICKKNTRKASAHILAPIANAWDTSQRSAGKSGGNHQYRRGTEAEVLKEGEEILEET